MTRLALLRVTTLPFEMLAPLHARRSTASLSELLDLEEARESASGRLTEALHRAAGESEADAGSEKARARLAIVSLRRDIHNGRPLASGKIEQVLPHLPPETASVLAAYEALLARRASVAGRWRRELEEDEAACRTALLELISRPLVGEGLHLASRSLASRARHLDRRPATAWGHRERHVAAKAAAYLARFCTKTSPNGVFVSTGLAWIGGGPPGLEGDPGIERVDVTLNILEAGKVAACLGADPEIARVLVPRANPTLRESGGVWTYWTPASLRNPTEEEKLCRAKDQPVLRAFIETAAESTHRTGELIDAVASRCDVEREKLSRFMSLLVERGILISEIEIPYNERRPLRRLAAAVAGAGCSPPWLRKVEEIESEVDRLAGLASGERSAAMERIGEVLEELPHNRPLARDELFRLDAATALRARLPAQILEDLRTAMRAYVRLFASMYPAGIYRRRFVTKFLKLHPPDTDVPLLDLYHGFAEPEEQGERPAAFPVPAGGREEGGTRRDPAEAMLRLRDTIARLAGELGSGHEVAIDDAMVDEITGGLPEPRWACGVLFQIAAPDWESVVSGRYRLVLSSLFNGAGLALGRFAHLHAGGAPAEDGAIAAELRRAWTCVERDGAVVAEVSYNHHARTANAGLRPTIFGHEIEMPGERTSPRAVPIPMRDLLVRYDTAARRFILRWAPGGREVIPVISSGVDPVGISAFLVAIGQQGLQPVGYFPGFDKDGVSRWPRVACGRVVLFRERWVFRAGGWPALAAGTDPAGELLELARWRRRHGLPRHVYVHTSEEPKPRYMDLESPVFGDLLRRVLAVLPGKAGSTLHVAEMNPGPEDLWVSGPAGRHPSELLVQMEGPSARNPIG